tara:strand:- start:63 stop:476 length:414 start_codon:yes stop_codon:yes gene_type:complete
LNKLGFLPSLLCLLEALCSLEPLSTLNITRKINNERNTKRRLPVRRFSIFLSNMDAHGVPFILRSVGMNPLEAIAIAEGFVDADSEEKYVEAWQHLLDTGLVWSLQGWFGRTAVAMIEAGQIIVKEVGEDEPAEVLL